MTSLSQSGLIDMADADETTTTLFTFASTHAFSTFFVPVTAGSISSTFVYTRIKTNLWVNQGKIGFPISQPRVTLFLSQTGLSKRY
jgi:hypothetical protein